jgi:NADP-dependent 3-hydroxy acid dehydrogenase YdfG
MPGATMSRSWSSSGVDESRLMKAEDVAEIVWTSTQLSSQANVESIVIRPLEGDI